MLATIHGSQRQKEELRFKKFRARYFPANAFCSFARSSFFICHTSCVTRCSPAASFTHSAKNFAGMICQESPGQPGGQSSLLTVSRLGNSLVSITAHVLPHLVMPIRPFVAALRSDDVTKNGRTSSRSAAVNSIYRRQKMRRHLPPNYRLRLIVS